MASAEVAQGDRSYVPRDAPGESRDQDVGGLHKNAHARDVDGEQRDTAAAQRDTVAARRDSEAAHRDTEAQFRDTEAEFRDTDGVSRDTEADRRDQSADERDENADQRDRDADLRDEADANSASHASMADQRSAALQREYAASDRRRAMDDREEAASERSQAGLDRNTALADRTAGASRRVFAGVDRDIASADRAAGATRRDSSGLDRDTALADRTSSAEDRQYASQLAVSLQFGWSVRQLDPPLMLYASPGYLRMLGLDQTRSDFTISEALAMVHPDDVPAVPENFSNADPDRPAVDTEIRIVRPDGAVRWIRCISNPVFDAAGAVFRAATTFEDITARKEAETSLRLAQSEAEKSNLAKTLFLSRMSHELRTPLNEVLGFAQLLELDPHSASRGDAVKHVLNGGRRLLEMIDNTLDLSRLETGKISALAESVLVGPLIAEIIRCMRPIAQATGIEIRQSISALVGRRYVLGDRGRLRQVLVELASNAIKYNSAGGSVDIDCLLSADQTALVFVVSDTGCGIRPENMASLFVPFEGVNEKRSDIEGIGVGLALSHRLVSLMGGRLDVASTVGEGSTFSVSMPLAAAMPAGASASGRESSGVGPEIIRSTLLLIEDDKSTVALVGRILELRPDWGIVSASSGSHGMELAHSLKPTVILIDATLPDMDSVDIIRGLRSNAAVADTPLVILSPDGSRTEIRRFQSAGATQHITTPLDVREVLALFDAYANQPHNSAA